MSNKTLFMEKMSDLKDLLKHEIEDLYSVEEQMLEALPKMIEKAKSNVLKASLSDHLRVTDEHKNRLDKIQQMINKESKEERSSKKGFLSSLFGSGKQVCKGMQGIIEEGNKIMSANITPHVRDAAIIACAQKMEHYEICGYGTARSYANELHLAKVAQLLEQTLNEEYEADRKLTVLATGRINRKADAGAAQHTEKALPVAVNRNKISTERAKSRGKILGPAHTQTPAAPATKGEKPKTLTPARGGTARPSSEVGHAAGNRQKTTTERKSDGNSGNTASGKGTRKANS